MDLSNPSPARPGQAAIEAGGGAAADPEEIKQKDAEVQRLNMLVKQRDNEIGILLNYLNKQKEQGGDTSVPVNSTMANGGVDSTQYSN